MKPKVLLTKDGNMLIIVSPCYIQQDIEIDVSLGYMVCSELKQVGWYLDNGESTTFIHDLWSTNEYCDTIGEL